MSTFLDREWAWAKQNPQKVWGWAAMTWEGPPDLRDHQTSMHMIPLTPSWHVTGLEDEVAALKAESALGHNFSATPRVKLPPDWSREDMVVVVDSETGQLLGCMGRAIWDAQLKSSNAAIATPPPIQEPK